MSSKSTRIRKSPLRLEDETAASGVYDKIKRPKIAASTRDQDTSDDSDEEPLSSKIKGSAKKRPPAKPSKKAKSPKPAKKVKSPKPVKKAKPAKKAKYLNPPKV
jgi:hypothetical protein